MWHESGLRHARPCQTLLDGRHFRYARSSANARLRSRRRLIASHVLAKISTSNDCTDRVDPQC